MQEEKNQPYRAYLLRCWREGEEVPGKAPRWRFSVEEVLPGRHPKRGFSNLEALLAFLQSELVGGEEKLSDDKEI